MSKSKALAVYAIAASKKAESMRKACGLILVSLAISACATYHPQAAKPTKRYYIVGENDNFDSIAFAFEISTERLRLANPWLKPSNISAGMRLTIPRDPLDKQISATSENRQFIWPVNDIDVSSTFGYRHGELHAGIDLRAPRGTEIYASAAGRVVFSGSRPGYGRMIVIDHENGIETVYAHNNRNLAEVGQRVRQGQLVASVGRSGNATGYHVHFEIRRLGKSVNPVSYLNAGL